MTDFEKVIDFNNLYHAYRKAKRGKGHKHSSAKFVTQALDGVHRIRSLLETKRYAVAEYNRFYVYEPKKRLIEAAAFKDKVVQHSLCDNVLLPKLEEVFIRNNFAGQKGKDTLFGLNTLKEHMMGFYERYGGGYILKADITKFFYTIDHSVLKQMLRKHFSDPDLLWLCDLIIDSTENPGLPLGNQTSQVFALLYLNELDHYITSDMGIEYYGRYMDDFYLLHPDKQHLKKCLAEIEEKVRGLKLTLNGKTQIMPFKQGIKFLGFHMYVKDGALVCNVKNENKRNAYRKYKRMAKLVVSGKLDERKLGECVVSWKAHAAFGDCEGVVTNLEKQIKKIVEEK